MTGLKIEFLYNKIESVGSISEAIRDISSLPKSLFIMDKVALIVAPISAVELAIPLPIGILLLISRDIFSHSLSGILNLSNTFSIAFLDFLGPKLIFSFFSSRVATENMSIA
ncbi:hypothetical protein SDC9_134276 [bioreactor metagenome]|uniref:Uncharacterized protein n=1 Tax=bioreactor metagenome TaxID=1076179 RepID=A0A645DF26_9ZZZZ